MNMKKHWNRFWTLNRHHADGFTLVELIVVIAILAILAGIGVPAYSGYVEKANMIADQTLVSEVANALVLHYYSAETPAAGYVMLTQSGASADGDFADAAMTAAFGENWDEDGTIALKYDGWTDDGLMSYVVENAAMAKTVANSPYLQAYTSEQLMNTVTDMTINASGVMGNRYFKEGVSEEVAVADMKESLVSLVGQDFVDQLEDLEEEGLVAGNNDDYKTAISNLLVTYVANDMAENQDNPSNTKFITQLATQYAGMYAYASTVEGGDVIMEQINTALASASSSTDLGAALQSDEDFYNGYLNYMTPDEEGNSAGMDAMMAAMQIVGAASTVSGNYSEDLDALKKTDLYKSEPVTNHVNNYVTAVNAVANMTEEQIATLSGAGAGNVIVLIGADGSVSVNPVQALAG